MNWVKSWCVVGVVALLAVGCDSAPPPPPSQPPPPPAPEITEKPRPTTQELLSGSWKPLPIEGMPLVIQVPESWSTRNAGDLLLVEGPTPSDQAGLRIAQRDSIPVDRFQPMIDQMKREAEARTGDLKLIETRNAGRMMLLERRWTEAPIRLPKPEMRGNQQSTSAGEPEMMTTTPVRWTVNAFVPAGQEYLFYQLTGIGLTAEQMEADKELLEKVIRSLSYVGEAPATAPAGNP